MPRRVPTTRWNVILVAGHESSPDAREALDDLCKRYWDPVHEFVRHRGHDAEKARDLTQGFFLSLLERKSVATADPARARFRSWLLGAAKHYLANERDKDNASRRGERNAGAARG